MNLPHVLALGALAVSAAVGQQTPDPPTDPAAPPAVQPVQNPPVQAPEDKRIFGVLPNNRTTENSIPFQRITGKQKMTIAYKDSFDWPVYPTSALFATLNQLENQNPSFGEGMAGYAKRF